MPEVMVEKGGRFVGVAEQEPPSPRGTGHVHVDRNAPSASRRATVRGQVKARTAGSGSLRRMVADVATTAPRFDRQLADPLPITV